MDAIKLSRAMVFLVVSGSLAAAQGSTTHDCRFVRSGTRPYAWVGISNLLMRDFIGVDRALATIPVTSHYCGVRQKSYSFQNSPFRIQMQMVGEGAGDVGCPFRTPARDRDLRVNARRRFFSNELVYRTAPVRVGRPLTDAELNTPIEFGHMVWSLGLSRPIRQNIPSELVALHDTPLRLTLNGEWRSQMEIHLAEEDFHVRLECHAIVE